MYSTGGVLCLKDTTEKTSCCEIPKGVFVVFFISLSSWGNLRYITVYSQDPFTEGSLRHTCIRAICLEAERYWGHTDRGGWDGWEHMGILLLGREANDRLWRYATYDLWPLTTEWLHQPKQCSSWGANSALRSSKSHGQTAWTHGFWKAGQFRSLDFRCCHIWKCKSLNKHSVAQQPKV